jgi:hypothetical protein
MHFLVELIAAGFLADGQICPRPSPHDALRLVEDGQFVRARQVIPGLVEDAKRTGSAAGWQAKLWQAEAVALFERSKTVFERVYGSGHPDTIAATYAPGAALTKSTPARAEVMVRQAVANWRASQPERHSNMVKVSGSAGVLALGAGGRQRSWGTRRTSTPAIARTIRPGASACDCSDVRARALAQGDWRGKEAAALKKEADRIGALKGYRKPGRHQIDILALRGRY